MFSISKLEIYGIIAAVLLSCIAGVGMYVHHLEVEVKDAKAAAASSHKEAMTAQAQLAANSSASAISDAGAHRDSLSITLHEANANALQKSPGAGQPIDPALNDAGRRGLCHYADYASDPACAGLRSSDPAKAP